MDITFEHRVDVLGILTYQRFWVATVHITVLLFHSSARFLALSVGITKETEPVAGTAGVHHLVRGVTLDIAVSPTGLVARLAAQVVQDSVTGVTWVLCNGFLHYALPLGRDLRQQCHLAQVRTSTIRLCPQVDAVDVLAGNLTVLAELVQSSQGACHVRRHTLVRLVYGPRILAVAPIC